MPLINSIDLAKRYGNHEIALMFNSAAGGGSSSGGGSSIIGGNSFIFMDTHSTIGGSS